MAFDGITTYKVIEELRQKIEGGKIDKIYQPEKDEIVLTIRRPGQVYRLLLSAHMDSARFYLTENKPETPLEPPMFCMLFRKHFGGGKLMHLEQVGFDRILEMDVEVYNELGDLCRKKIILEIMGRHSNLILVDENGRIIDCAHHVGQDMSHFRMVLPGLPYEAPSHNQRANPLLMEDVDRFTAVWQNCHAPIGKGMYQVFNGISPFAAAEICFRAGVSEKASFEDLTQEERERLYQAFTQLFCEMREKAAHPEIFLDGDRMREYSMVESRLMAGVERKTFDTPSALLDVYYVRQDTKNRLRQKAQDLHKLVMTHLDRARRKYDLQQKQMQDTQGREKYQRMGDLITANIYRIQMGERSLIAEDFYQDPPVEVEIALKENLTPAQNAQKYYAKYNKLKRTEEALTEQLQQTEEEIQYLESLLTAMEMADCEKDLEDIRLELYETGYVRKNRQKRKNLAASKPLTMRTSEGLEVMVGKNNIQNDQLTFKMASPFDLWFHVKDIPGSHTVLFCSGKEYGKDYTEQSILEAAQIAAGHSRAAQSSRVPVDYAERRYVKKPSGSKPGFVIYTHQKTLFVEPQSSESTL